MPQLWSCFQCCSADLLNVNYFNILLIRVSWLFSLKEKTIGAFMLIHKTCKRWHFALLVVEQSLMSASSTKAFLFALLEISLIVDPSVHTCEGLLLSICWADWGSNYLMYWKSPVMHQFFVNFICAQNVHYEWAFASTFIYMTNMYMNYIL